MDVITVSTMLTPLWIACGALGVLALGLVTAIRHGAGDRPRSRRK